MIRVHLNYVADMFYGNNRHTNVECRCFSTLNSVLIYTAFQTLFLEWNINEFTNNLRKRETLLNFWKGLRIISPFIRLWSVGGWKWVMIHFALCFGRTWRISAAHCGQFVMICVCKSMEFGCAGVTVFSSVHSRKADAINTLSVALP